MGLPLPGREQEPPAVRVLPKQLERRGARHGLHHDVPALAGGQHAGGAYRLGERPEARGLLYRHQILAVPPVRLPGRAPPAERVEGRLPQPQAGKCGQRHRNAAGVQHHPRHVVRQHGVTALAHRPEQRRFAGVSGAEEQYRAGAGFDGGGMKGDHAALLQQDGERRSADQVADLAVAPAARLDEHVAAVRHQHPRHRFEIQQEGAGHHFHPPFPHHRRGQRGRRRADANRHVRPPAAGAGQAAEGKDNGRADVQPPGHVILLLPVHAAGHCTFSWRRRAGGCSSGTHGAGWMYHSRRPGRRARRHRPVAGALPDDPPGHRAPRCRNAHE